MKIGPRKITMRDIVAGYYDDGEGQARVEGDDLAYVACRS